MGDNTFTLPVMLCLFTMSHFKGGTCGSVDQVPGCCCLPDADFFSYSLQDNVFPKSYSISQKLLMVPIQDQVPTSNQLLHSSSQPCSLGISALGERINGRRKKATPPSGENKGSDLGNDCNVAKKLSKRRQLRLSNSKLPILIIIFNGIQKMISDCVQLPFDLLHTVILSITDVD